MKRKPGLVDKHRKVSAWCRCGHDIFDHASFGRGAPCEHKHCTCRCAMYDARGVAATKRDADAHAAGAALVALLARLGAPAAGTGAAGMSKQQKKKKKITGGLHR